MPIEALDRQDRLVPERSFRAILELIRQREGIADIGFQLGTNCHVMDIEDLRSLLSGHPALMKTSEAFCSLLTSHNNTWDYWIESSSEGIRLCRRTPPIDLGYAQVAAFSKSFRRWTGVSPSAYRKANREDIA